MGSHFFAFNNISCFIDPNKKEICRTSIGKFFASVGVLVIGEPELQRFARAFDTLDSRGAPRLSLVSLAKDVEMAQMERRRQCVARR